MKFTICLLLFTLYAKATFANSITSYCNRKDGITFIATINDNRDSLLYDAFFKKLVNKIHRNDKTISIRILVDHTSVKNRDEKLGFASISFDTLREEDPFFIRYYYEYRQGKFKDYYGELPPTNKYKIDLQEPIDLNSSFNDSSYELGLKVIYNFGITDSLDRFDRIYTYVQYGIDNIEKVKKHQRRIVMDFKFGPFQISLLTLDTNQIKRIPLLSLGFDPRHLNGRSFNRVYLVIILLILSLLLVLFYKKSNKNR